MDAEGIFLIVYNHHYHEKKPFKQGNCQFHY